MSWQATKRLSSLVAVGGRHRKQQARTGSPNNGVLPNAMDGLGEAYSSSSSDEGGEGADSVGVGPRNGSAGLERLSGISGLSKEAILPVGNLRSDSSLRGSSNLRPKP